MAALFRRLKWREAQWERWTAIVAAKDPFVEPSVENYRLRFPTDRTRQFRAVTYNLLAPCYALHPEIGGCPREVLEWDFRRERIKSQILQWNADVISLQEVERKIFEQELEPWFMDIGYEGIFFCKHPEVDEGFEEGIALMYKKTSFVRISSVCAPFREFFDPIGKGLFFRRLKTLKDGFAMALLHHKDSGREILVAGLQLYYHTGWPDARIAQIHVLCETLLSFLNRQSRPRHTPVVLLGDFASYWRKWTADAFDKWVEDRFIVSGVYTLLTERSIDSRHCHHPFVRNHQGTVRRSGIKEMRFTTSDLRFESAFMRAHGTEPLVTKYTTRCKEPRDYVFFTPETLDVVSTLPLPYSAHPILRPEQLKIQLMPNAHYPSNHIPMGATLTLRI